MVVYQVVIINVPKNGHSLVVIIIIIIYYYYGYR